MHDADYWTDADLEERYPVDPDTGKRANNPATGKPFQPGDHKKTHFHVCLWLGEKVRRTQLAKIFNAMLPDGAAIEERNFLPMDAQEEALMYLTHANRPHKHQYEENLVFSNFDWVALRDGKKKDSELEAVLKRIEAGEITRNNIARMTDAIFYAKYKSKLELAFEHFDLKHKHDKIIRTNIYICPYEKSAGSGVGKSLLAEEWARALCDRLGWDYCFMGSGKDILDGYRGEEVVILDDRGFDTMDRKFFLNFFDISAKGAMPSRFRDKAPRWRMSIVTNITPFEEEIGKVKGLSSDEDLTQVRRRFAYIIKVSPDTIYLYSYDDNKKKHVLQDSCKNFMLADVIDEEKNDHRIESQGMAFIAGLASSIRQHRDSYMRRQTAEDEEFASLLPEQKKELLAYAREKGYLCENIDDDLDLPF